MKITDEAVNAAAKAMADSIGHGLREKTCDHARAALEAALPHLSQGAVREGNVELVAGWDELKDSLPTDHAKAAEALFDYGDKLADHLSALSPAPVGVTDEMVEIVGKKVADFLGYAWEGLNSHSVVEQGYRMFTHGQFGWSFHGGQPDLRNVARDLLEAALASHEPAPTDTQEGKELGYDAHGNLTTFDVRDDDTQEGVSEAGEVVWHRYCWTDNPDVWLGSKDDPRILLGHSNFVVEPLVRQSALTACQQELERLRVQKDEWKERAATVKRKLSAEYERAEAAEARIAELVKELEKIKAEATIANDVIRLNRDNGGQGRVKVATAMHRIAAVARATLGGQSNE